LRAHLQTAARRTASSSYRHARVLPPSARLRSLHRRSAGHRSPRALPQGGPRSP
jgi:hypothetical protein